MWLVSYSTNIGSVFSNVTNCIFFFFVYLCLRSNNKVFYFLFITLFFLKHLHAEAGFMLNKYNINYPSSPTSIQLIPSSYASSAEMEKPILPKRFLQKQKPSHQFVKTSNQSLKCWTFRVASCIFVKDSIELIKVSWLP